LRKEEDGRFLIIHFSPQVENSRREEEETTNKPGKKKLRIESEEGE